MVPFRCFHVRLLVSNSPKGPKVAVIALDLFTEKWDEAGDTE
jgi:hypothetical protein